LMPKKRTLRKLHIYSGIFSAVLGVYLWIEPKWRVWRRKSRERR